MGRTTTRARFYSRGFAREELRNRSDFAVLDSTTVGAELNTAVGGRLRLAVSGSTGLQDRVNRLALRQNSVSVTLGVKF